MKANTTKTMALLCLLILHLFTYSTVFAKTSGGGAIAGGGGDASESKVNTIRGDILNWIQRGGAKGLELGDISYSEYVAKMKTILQAQNVVIGFVENDHPTNSELQVNVDGVPKTCRGFLSIKDQRPHMLCNIGRFSNTLDSDLYPLIHHEYAGLIGLEKNDGAASDYAISSQLTAYLERTVELKLEIKKQIYSNGKQLPLIELKGTRYLGNMIFEVTLIASRMDDVTEVKSLGWANNSDSNKCEFKYPELIFTQQKNEASFRVDLKKTDCYYGNVRIKDFTVEFQDGIIGTTGYKEIIYNSSKFFGDNNESYFLPSFIKKKMKVIKEVRGDDIILDKYNYAKTKYKTIETSFSVKAEDLAQYQAVISSDGDEIKSQNPEDLANFINNKKILADVYFEEYYEVKYIKLLGQVVGSYWQVKKDGYYRPYGKTHALATLTLISKDNFASRHIEYPMEIIE